MPTYESRRRFEARLPDGQPIALVAIYSKLTVETRGGEQSAGPPRSRIETEDGAAVNRLSKGRYELVAEGVQLTSDDPEAP